MYLPVPASVEASLQAKQKPLMHVQVAASKTGCVERPACNPDPGTKYVRKRSIQYATWIKRCKEWFALEILLTRYFISRTLPCAKQQLPPQETTRWYFQEFHSSDRVSEFRI
jgi:hypothetical protein